MRNYGLKSRFLTNKLEPSKDASCKHLVPCRSWFVPISIIADLLVSKVIMPHLNVSLL